MLMRPGAYVIAGRLYSWWKSAATLLGGKQQATLVRDIIASRPPDRRQLFALPADASVQEAVRVMLRHRISAVLVLAPRGSSGSMRSSTIGPGGSEFVPLGASGASGSVSLPSGRSVPTGLGAHCDSAALSTTAPSSSPTNVLGMITQSDILKHYGAESASTSPPGLCSSTVVGLVTESDVLRRAVAEDRSPSGTPLSRVMTPFADLAYAFPENSVESALQILAAVGAHHLPVLDDFPSGNVEAPGATAGGADDAAAGAPSTAAPLDDGGAGSVQFTVNGRAGVRRGGTIRALVSLPELVGLTRGVREAREKAALMLGPISRIGAREGQSVATEPAAEASATGPADSRDVANGHGHELELHLELSEPSENETRAADMPASAQPGTGFAPVRPAP